MYEFKSREILEIVKEIEALREHVENRKREITLAFSSWDVKHDARLTIFANVISVTNSTHLAMIFVGQHLCDPSWWPNTTKRDRPIPSEAKRVYLISEYDTFVRIGFVQTLLSSVESGFRILLRALDPAACIAGTAEFKSVYDCLLKSKVSSTPKESIELMDLLRYIRNTIHNNGLYFSRSGTDEQVVYEGRSYTFVHGKSVDFVTWGLLISLVRNLVDLTAQVVVDTNVAGIGTIQDPFTMK